MKNTFFTIILAVFNFCLFSQNITLTIGGEIKRSDYDKRLVGADSKAFYTADYSEDMSSDFTLTKYSCLDVKMIYSKEIQIPNVNNKKCNAKTILLVDGDLILFTTQYDKANQVTKLYANKFNSDGSISQDSKLISEIPAIDKKQVGFFYFTVSENNKTMVILSEKPSSETDSIRYNWKIIDKDLTVLWNKSMNLPYYGLSSDYTTKMDYKNDKVYFIATNLKDLSIKDRKKAIAKNKLYCYDFKKSKLTELLFNVDYRKLFDFNLNFNNKNQIIVTGLYSYSDKSDKQGLFNIDSQLRRESGVFFEIYDETLETNFYKDTIPNEDNRAYYVKDVFLNNDGSVMIISENNYTVESHKMGNAPTYDYNSNDVLVHVFNPNNKSKWIKRIKKEQHDTMESDFFSIISLSNHNTLSLFINDNRKNNLENPVFKFENFQLEKNAQTKILQVDNTGIIKENKSTTDFIDSKNIIRCKRKIRINESEIIVGIKTEDGNRFAKISLK